MGRTKQTLVAVAFTLVSCSTPIVPAATPITEVTTLRVYATTETTSLLYSLTTAYRQLHPEIAFEFANGSFASMTERVLNEDGVYFFSHHLPEGIDNPESHFWAAPVGQDALAIIVNPANPESGISIEQLRAIYEGRILQWRALGGAARDVAVITRDQGTGLGAEFSSLVMGNRETVSTAQVVPTDDAMTESIAQQTDAIGYVSLSALNESVRSLAVENVLPSSETVYDNTYPLRMTLYIVGRSEPVEDYPEMRAFIGWVQSPEGQQVVAQEYAPLLRP